MSCNWSFPLSFLLRKTKMSFGGSNVNIFFIATGIYFSLSRCHFRSQRSFMRSWMSSTRNVLICIILIQYAISCIFFNIFNSFLYFQIPFILLCIILIQYTTSCILCSTSKSLLYISLFAYENEIVVVAIRLIVS